MTLKEGQSTTRPPLLEGSNYASWKPKMKSFLKSLDERAWKAVLTGWTEPTMENLIEKLFRNQKLYGLRRMTEHPWETLRP
ncbi:unnamed protein product [Rhodiola kirilowii]